MGSNEISQMYQSFRRVLILIGVVHLLLVIVALWLLYGVKANVIDLPTSNKVLVINVSLLSFVGSLLYFSRKVYSYLITDKFGRVMLDHKITTGHNDDELHRLKSAVAGYYVYLSTRPLAGFVIGPLLLMFVLGGLTTLSKRAPGSEVAISTAGIYLIYVVSFIGGYSSSDLFDYFSNLGGKLIRNLDLK